MPRHVAGTTPAEGNSSHGTTPVGHCLHASRDWPPNHAAVLPALMSELEAEMDELLTRQHQELRSRLQAFAARAARGQCSGAAPESFHQGSSGGFELASESHSPEMMDIPMPGHCYEDSGVKTLQTEVINDKWSPPTSVVPSAPRLNNRGPEDFGDVNPLDVSDDDGQSINAIMSPPSAIDVLGSHKGGRGKTRHRASLKLEQKAKRGNDWRAKLLRLTFSARYEMANAVAILVNALFIAWETQHSAERVPAIAHEIYFDVLMLLFCAVFTGDLILRLTAQGSLFFCTTEWKWNSFDVVVVIGSNLEAIAFLTDKRDDWFSKYSLLRVLRLVRVVRFVRALRSFVFFRDLRITVSVLCGSLMPMMPFVIIMTLIFMTFGILFTDGASEHMVSHGVDPQLMKYYGSLFVTMSTLFKAITGGIDWEVAAEPLESMNALYSITFYSYMAFSIFALLNVVNAMFIDKTLQRSRQDRDFVVQTEQDGKREFLDTMDRLFTELDHDGTGTISVKGLHQRLQDPKICAYFKAIDLKVYKVEKLFQLLDVDKSGAIDHLEFKKGCDRLRGDASQLDQALMQYQMKALGKESRAIKELLTMQALQRLDPCDRMGKSKPILRASSTVQALS